MDKMVLLLVGTVMTLGSVFSFWGAQLVQNRLSSASNRTSEEICIGAMFRLYTASYDKDKEELLLTLENQRRVDIKLKYLYLFYPNKEMKIHDLNEDLQGIMLKTITIKSVKDGFETGTIKTNCPDLTLDFTYSDTT